MSAAGNHNRLGEFWRDSLLLFLALRAADAINLYVAFELVPRYVAPAELGGVLPLVSFATLLSLPLFALAMAVMRESSVLCAKGEYGRLKSLLAGIFAAVGVFGAVALALGGLLLPRALGALRIASAAGGTLAVASAFLGCLAPVYTDALQALKKFGALGAVEIAGAALRGGLLAIVMPFAPVAGYFAGQCLPPLVRIAGGTLAIGKVWREPSCNWWTPASCRRLLGVFLQLLVYLGAPMLAGTAEQWALRTHCGDYESAGYYLLSRLSDLPNLIALPLLLVLFPYTAGAAERGGNARIYVRHAVVAMLAATALFATVYLRWGSQLLALLPNGELYAALSPALPVLAMASGLTACQTLCTNAAAAAGRFGFLAWFVPLHLGYAAVLQCGVADGAGIYGMAAVMLAVSVVRFVMGYSSDPKRTVQGPWRRQHSRTAATSGST